MFTVTFRVECVPFHVVINFRVQIWRDLVDIIYKGSQKLDKLWSSSLGVGR